MRSDRLALPLAALLACALPPGCASPGRASSPGGATALKPAPDPWPGPRRVDGVEAKALVARGAVLLDVRPADSFEWEKLPGAVNLPLDELEVAKDLFAPLSTPIVVYCTAGLMSAQAFRQLQAMGFTHVYDLGPMSGWR
jgi:phage shock protein E